MSQIEIIHLSLKDYCEFLGDSNYYFRNNATSRMYIKDNKIWKFDDWEFFSTESPVINYRKELERLNVNVPRELIYLEDNYVGYTISFINGFDLATLFILLEYWNLFLKMLYMTVINKQKNI